VLRLASYGKQLARQRADVRVDCAVDTKLKLISGSRGLITGMVTTMRTQIGARANPLQKLLQKLHPTAVSRTHPHSLTTRGGRPASKHLHITHPSSEVHEPLPTPAKLISALRQPGAQARGRIAFREGEQLAHHYEAYSSEEYDRRRPPSEQIVCGWAPRVTLHRCRSCDTGTAAHGTLGNNYITD
jgi:hypothetical protein